jgi:V8-like Glu-specific endopeptidase
MVFANIQNTYAIESGKNESGSTKVVPINVVTEVGFTAPCTGSQISPSIVVTAGHCLLDSKNKVSSNIRVGNPGSADKNTEASYKSWTRASYIQMSETFINTGLTRPDDIAFIKLSKPIKMTTRVRLATPIEIEGLSKTNAQLKIFGYGLLNDKGQYAVTPSSLVGTFGSIYSNSLNQFSIRTLNSRTCEGDSGGPIYLNIEGESILIGILNGSPTVMKKHCSDMQPSGYFEQVGTFIHPYFEQAKSAGYSESEFDAQKVATVMIKCTKGKLIKKVSGSNPKCPAGYKKVS